MRVGYYGGSFDPPHRAHLAVACAARDAFALNRVLLAPTGKQPLKPSGAMAPFADRLAMVELLCRGQDALQSSAIDAPRPGAEANYTVDTLLRLSAGLPPDTELFAIAGADAFLTLPHWRSPGLLLELAQWIVVSRPGVPPGALDELTLTPEQRARVHWLGTLQDPASATNLREQLQHGAVSSAALPEDVAAYIAGHRLYRG